MAVFITWIPCSCFLRKRMSITYANKTAHEIWGVGNNHLVLCILIAYFVFASKFFINEKCELIIKPKGLVLST